MATHILGRDHAVLIPDPVNASHRVEGRECDEFHEHEGSVARGFFFAMVFNVVLVLAVLGVWQIWCALR